MKKSLIGILATFFTGVALLLVGVLFRITHLPFGRLLLNVGMIALLIAVIWAIATIISRRKKPDNS